MSKIPSGASYIQDEQITSQQRLGLNKRAPIVVVLSSIFAILLMLLTVQPLASNLKNPISPELPVIGQTEAGAMGFLCSTKMGEGMDRRGIWNSTFVTPPHADKKNRKWTAKEAFGNNLAFVNYEGEGGKDTLFVTEKPENKTKPGNYDKVSSKFDGLRTVSNCTAVTALTSLSNVIMNIAGVATAVTGSIVTFAFDSNVICNDPKNPKGACLNLLKIIGGTGSSNGGIIGVLTSGIYMPLLVIVVAISGFWVANTAFRKQKLREAAFGALWIAASVILGLALLWNPALLAKAPMAASNSISACVIGAFNGENCFNGSSTSSKIDMNSGTGGGSKNICRSDASGLSLEEKMSMTVNSLSCSIWKSFVLEPYAQGSFGTSLATLDTTSKNTSAVIKKAGLAPEEFCVNLGSTQSADQQNNKTLRLNSAGNRACNLLIYQAYLQTNAITEGDNVPAAGKTDTRWYKLAVVAAHDDGLWNQWAGSTTGSMHKIGIALLALFTAGLGGFILIVIAIFALIYYFSSVLLLPFAPIFALMGVNPGRGRKLLLGWIEKVISNVLKYLISAVFLIVAVTLYGAVLGNASNMGVTLMFILILSGALFLYRKELIDLIGRANMSGEQLSSKLSERLGQGVKGVTKLGTSAAGSGLGAAIAGGRFSSGAKDGFKRELQRGATTQDIFGKSLGGVATNAARQYSRNVVDNAQDIKTQAREEAAAHTAANEELNSVRTEYDDLSGDLRKLDSDSEIHKIELDRTSNIEGQIEEIDNRVARDMAEENPYFAQAQQLTNQLKDLKLNLEIAKVNGDTEGMQSILTDMEMVKAQRAQLLEQVPQSELKRLNNMYRGRVRDERDKAGLSDYTNADRNDYESLMVISSTIQRERDELVNRINSAAERGRELQETVARRGVAAEELSRFDKDRQPGDDYTKTKIDKFNRDLEKKQDAAVDSIDNNFVNAEDRQIWESPLEDPTKRNNGGDEPNSGDSPNDDRPDSGGGGGAPDRLNDDKPRADHQPEDQPRPQPDHRPQPDYKPEPRPRPDQSDRQPYENIPDSNDIPTQPLKPEVPEPIVNRQPDHKEDRLPDFDTKEESNSEDRLPDIHLTSSIPERPQQPQSRRSMRDSETSTESLPEFDNTAKSEPSKTERRLPEPTPQRDMRSPKMAQVNDDQDVMPKASSDRKFRDEVSKEVSRMSNEASNEMKNTKFEADYEKIYQRLNDAAKHSSGDMDKLESKLGAITRENERLEAEINKKSPSDLGPLASQMREDIDMMVDKIYHQKMSRMESRAEPRPQRVAEAPTVREDRAPQSTRPESRAETQREAPRINESSTSRTNENRLPKESRPKEDNRNSPRESQQPVREVIREKEVIRENVVPSENNNITNSKRTSDANKVTMDTSSRAEAPRQSRAEPSYSKSEVDSKINEALSKDRAARDKSFSDIENALSQLKGAFGNSRQSEKVETIESKVREIRKGDSNVSKDEITNLVKEVLDQQRQTNRMYPEKVTEESNAAYDSISRSLTNISNTQDRSESSDNGKTNNTPIRNRRSVGDEKPNKLVDRDTKITNLRNRRGGIPIINPDDTE